MDGYMEDSRRNIVMIIDRIVEGNQKKSEAALLLQPSFENTASIPDYL